MGANLYGYGSGAGPNHRLRKQFEALVGDDDRRRALGEYSRERITSRFDLKPVARVLAARYDEAVREGVRRSPFRVAEALVRAVAVGGAYQLKPLVPAQLRERFWSRHAAERIGRPHP
jgi:hypothetical protein